MKKAWLNFCALAMALAITASCAITAFAYSEEDVIFVTEQYVSSWMSTDFQQYLDAGIDDEEALGKFAGWQGLKDTIGQMEEIVECQVTEADGVVSVTETVRFENGTILFTVKFDQAALEQADAFSAVLEIDAVSASEQGSGAGLGKGVLNTAMGMAIVFLVLIFISLIISMLKYIPGILERLTGKKAAVEEPISRPVKAPEPASEPESHWNEGEVAAAIMAAVAAYEAEAGAAPGTFVVRSIKRR